MKYFSSADTLISYELKYNCHLKYLVNNQMTCRLDSGSQSSKSANMKKNTRRIANTQYFLPRKPDSGSESLVNEDGKIVVYNIRSSLV